MKKLLAVLVLCSSNVLCARELVDTILARVNDTNILFSSMQIPQITKDGKLYSLDEAITEELWVQRAIERKVMPTDLEIDKQMIAIKQEYGLLDLSDDQADAALVKQIGLTFSQYRTQLRRYQAAEMMKGQEVRSRCSISRHEVSQQYYANPEVVIARYKLRLATLTAAQAQEWRTLSASTASLAWETLDWMVASEIAPHLHQVFSLKKGEVSEPIKTADGYLVVMLEDYVPARTKTLEECYAKVESELRHTKINLFAERMATDLRANAVVVIL